MQSKEVIVVNQQGGKSLKEKLILGGVVTGITGIGVYAAVKLAQRASSNVEDKKALVPDSIEDKAKRINQTFVGAGTDVVRLRQILRSIPDQEIFHKIATSYRKNYHNPLTRDMQGELYQTEYDELMAIIAAKPKQKGQPVSSETKAAAWAKRLYAAMSLYYWFFPSTDDEAIDVVFLEISTQKLYAMVKSAYKKLYASELEGDLIADVGYFKAMELKKQILRKPKT